MAALGRHVEAKAEYCLALSIDEKLVVDFPGVPNHRVKVAEDSRAIANLLRDTGSLEESLPWYDKAVAAHTAVVQQQPDDATASLHLRNSHGGRAKAYDGLKRHTEAVADWTRAIKLSPAKDQPMVRASRANSRVQAGQYAEAVAEVAELAKSDAWNGGQWYDFACVYAVASGKVAGKREEYAGRAVELLRRAVAKGFTDSGHVAEDRDLDPLRGRADFRKLVADLEAKHPRPPELAPPPRPAK